MEEYIFTQTLLWSLMATIRADQIDVAKLDPTLDVEKLKITKQAFNDALPDSEIKPEMYNEEMRRFFRIKLPGSTNGKKSP
jgi:hypothetical protein